MAKKIYALIPAEREQECYHLAGFAYTGRVPCTGLRVCHLCGTRADEAVIDAVPCGVCDWCVFNLRHHGRALLSLCREAPWVGAKAKA